MSVCVSAMVTVGFKLLDKFLQFLVILDEKTFTKVKLVIFCVA